MPKEYIEREAAIKARGRSCNRKCAECDFAIDGDSWCKGEVFVVNLLRIPAADVRPVVRAAWQSWEQDKPPCKWYSCDYCGFHTLSKSNYCPNCGADMREENDGKRILRIKRKM